MERLSKRKEEKKKKKRAQIPHKFNNCDTIRRIKPKILILNEYRLMVHHKDNPKIVKQKKGWGT